MKGRRVLLLAAALACVAARRWPRPSGSAIRRTGGAAAGTGRLGAERYLSSVLEVNGTYHMYFWGRDQPGRTRSTVLGHRTCHLVRWRDLGDGSLQPGAGPGRGRLASVTHRDEIAGLALRYAAGFFSRACLFVVHRGAVIGWTGRGHGVVVDDLQSFTVPLEEAALFQEFKSGAGYHLGPIPDGDANHGLLRVLGDPAPVSALLLPIRVRERAVAFLLADNPTSRCGAGRASGVGAGGGRPRDRGSDPAQEDLG